jgi:hypothetical protein
MLVGASNYFFTGDGIVNAGNSKNGTLLWMNVLGVTLFIAAIAALGCSKGSGVANDDHHAPGVSEEIRAQLAQLSDEDRKLAEAQVFCVVRPTNELGCMGVPCKLTIEGRPVFLCCEHCKDAALKDPKATLAALDGLLQKNSAMLQKNTK